MPVKPRSFSQRSGNNFCPFFLVSFFYFQTYDVEFQCSRRLQAHSNYELRSGRTLNGRFTIVYTRRTNGNIAVPRDTTPLILGAKPQNPPRSPIQHDSQSHFTLHDLWPDQILYDSIRTRVQSFPPHRYSSAPSHLKTRCLAAAQLSQPYNKRRLMPALPQSGAYPRIDLTPTVSSYSIATMSCRVKTRTIQLVSHIAHLRFCLIIYLTLVTVACVITERRISPNSHQRVSLYTCCDIHTHTSTSWCIFKSLLSIRNL